MTVPLAQPLPKAASIDQKRILSIDVLRGLVMLIMALDHVRDYFHIHGLDDDPTNMATTTTLLFFTRWITHFCAPVFLFLSGTSAYLVGQRKTKSELSLFLIKRGFWLVFVELVIMTFAITFNPFYNVFILQVIWAIGWSMVILGVLVRTSTVVIVTIGCILFFGHNLLSYVNIPKEGTAGIIWNVLITSPRKFFAIAENHNVFDIYAILPWTSAMLLGYGFGSFYRASIDKAIRKKRVLAAGIVLTLTFVILRLINHYGDPAPWSDQKNAVFTFLSFLNTTKYPPSLEYLCMTIGPSLILLALIENVHNRFTRILVVYGRVPFFYYVLHFFLIHLLCVIFFFASGYGWKDAVEPNNLFLFRPTHFGFDLGIVYAVWLFVIIVLYKPCKWFYQYKSMHHQWWLSYL